MTFSCQGSLTSKKGSRFFACRLFIINIITEARTITKKIDPKEKTFSLVALSKSSFNTDSPAAPKMGSDNDDTGKNIKTPIRISIITGGMKNHHESNLFFFANVLVSNLYFYKNLCFSRNFIKSANFLF